MLKFMVDTSTGIASARYLQAQGYDVIFVGEWGIQGQLILTSFGLL